MKRKGGASGFSQDAQELQMEISDNEEPSSPTPSDDPEDPPLGRPAKRARTIPHDCDATAKEIGVCVSTLDLGQKRFIAFHFCFNNNIDVTEIKIINQEGVFFATGQQQTKWERWINSKDPRLLELSALYNSEKEKEEWPDCNGGFQIKFKCPQEDEWMMSHSFWKMNVIWYISNQDSYENKDITLADMGQFHNYNEWDDFRISNEEEDWWDDSDYFMFHYWLNDTNDREKSNLEYLVEHWRKENNCTPVMEPAPTINSSAEVPKVFKDFIAKGIFFFYFIF